MVAGEFFELPAGGFRSIGERHLTHSEESSGRRADCRYHHHGALIPVLRNDVDGSPDTVSILQRRAAKLHYDHRSSPRPPPTRPRATASSAFRTEPPAAPRSVLCPSTVILKSSTEQGRKPPTKVAIPFSRSTSSLG